MLHESLSFKIIGCCFRVHNELGAGLLEQCYHNALFYELRACVLKLVIMQNSMLGIGGN